MIKTLCNNLLFAHTVLVGAAPSYMGNMWSIVYGRFFIYMSDCVYFTVYCQMSENDENKKNCSASPRPPKGSFPWHAGISDFNARN